MPYSSSRPKIPVDLTEAQFYVYVAPRIKAGTRGPKIKIPIYKIFKYVLFLLHTGCQWHRIPIDKDASGKPEISYVQLWKHYRRWTSLGFIEEIFIDSVERLSDNDLLDTSIIHGDGTSTVAKKGGDNLGRNGHKHHKGDKTMVLCDRNCNIISLPIAAPGNKNEGKFLKAMISSLKDMVKRAGLKIKDSILSFDGVYDIKSNRKHLFNNSMIPNIPKNIRNGNPNGLGRKRIYNEDIFDERFRTIERDFSWEDKFKRLLMRFEFISEMHYSLKILAYTMINLRHFV